MDLIRCLLDDVTWPRLPDRSQCRGRDKEIKDNEATRLLRVIPMENVLRFLKKNIAIAKEVCEEMFI